MDENDKLIESITKREKRDYQKSEQQSWKKLRISDEFGWDNEMRQIYFRLKSNYDKALQKIDYTNVENRKDSRTRKDFKKRADNHAYGIWSDSVYDDTLRTGTNFIKFVIWYEKNRKKSDEEYRDINKLADIRPYHVREFLMAKKEGRYGSWSGDGKACTNKTLNTLFGHIQKLSEATTAYGVKSHAKLIKTSHKEIIGEYRKADRVRGRGKTDGEKGYTIKQANEIIQALENDPYAQSLASVLTHVGLRMETVKKLQWSDIIDKNGKVKERFAITDGTKLKGGRVLAPQCPKTTQEKLQQIWDTGLFNKGGKVWGDKMSAHEMRKTFVQACEKAQVDYKGFHEFRAATVEHYENMAKEMSKEELVKSILAAVNSIEKVDLKSGEVIKPLNPLEKKKQWARDESGNRIVAGKKNGVLFYKKEIATDETGHPIMEQRYTYEKLMSRRLDFLQNTFIAQQISHNRSDANEPYRQEKRKK
ncbi:hypothetical protein NXB04_20875 [Bacillus paranthracis]|uniref:hypothetical protein n=1 Tax=Bacillus paranthracis TaxID=2026186 RepID=UPI00215079D6|nr:hypothetical protein [Bacillus paranthracis]MCR6465161.1 hypothetical protein [Bacillus paranthracis]MCR9021611.1 hypothetical protein [Bacillus paranthracis]